MADKKITDLQLISAVTGSLSLPVDNGIQTYRATPSQIKDFVLANQNILLAMLKDDILSGLTSVTAAEDDYLALIDTSDSSKNKKTLVSQFAKVGYSAATSTYAILTTDSTVKFSSASFTATLPTAVGVAGKRYRLVHAGTSLSQVYTLATTSSQLIGTIASGAYKLCTNGEVLDLESDGANWMIANHSAKVGLTTISTIPIGGTTTGPTKGGTPSSDQYRWGRNGEMGIFRYEFKSATGGSSGSGDYLISLPSNISMDSNKVSFYSTLNGAGTWPTPVALGSISFSDTANAQQATGSVIPYDATRFRLGLVQNNGSSPNRGVWGSSVFGMAGGAQTFTVDFTAPIVDWQP